MFNQYPLEQALQEAQSWIGEYWPLQAAVATNPLSDRVQNSFLETAEKLEEQGVETAFPLSFYYEEYRQGNITSEALEKAADFLGLSAHQKEWLTTEPKNPNFNEAIIQPPQILISERLYSDGKHQGESYVLQACTEWLARYFDQGEALWSPHKEKSLLEFWSEHHPNQIKPLEEYLNVLSIEPRYYALYFTRILFYLRGYASLIKWLNQHPNNPWVKGSADLKTLILIWLHYETQLVSKTQKSPGPIVLSEKKITPIGISTLLLKQIWQTAYEWSAHSRLMSALENHPASPKAENPSAQFIFCMDPRSEGFRRHLEEAPSFETFAAAGFFGFPFNLESSDNSICQWQSPGLLKAKQKVVCSAEPETRISFDKPLKKSLQNPLSAFGLIEWVNALPLIKLLLKQYAPGLYHRLIKKSKIKNQSFQIDNSSFSILEATRLAYGFLTGIGLTKSFAPFIFICGHEAEADNNPLVSSLQCGACGANSGKPNAALAASALNHPEIREGLRKLGMEIPKDTVFIAACHHTTTDELIFDAPKANSTLQGIALKIKAAAKKLRDERVQAWPSKDSSVWFKTKDWAELIPELGLANHTALIIGPRRYTRGLNLKRRVFLHDYDEKHDPTGEILESVLLGPGVVAHWINSYYYFSTVASQHFGGGNKTLHNLTGNVGVIEGNAGDLKIGLPEQSLRFRNQLLHEPRRLLWVIYASKSQVNKMIERHPILKQLIEGQWVWLNVIEKIPTP